MKRCETCGMENSDTAKFCAKCGQRLASQTQVMPPTQPEVPVAVAPQPQNNNKLKIILAVCVVLMILLVGAIIYLVKDDEGANEAAVEQYGPKVDYDSSFVSGYEVEADSMTVAEAPAEAPAVEPSKSSTVTARGDIEGYPYSVTGKWSGNKFSGTYKNEYNGVKMKCSGYEAEGVLELTLTSGKTTCTFILDDQGDGYFTGYFYPGEKPATLQFP